MIEVDFCSVGEVLAAHSHNILVEEQGIKKDC